MLWKNLEMLHHTDKIDLKVESINNKGQVIKTVARYHSNKKEAERQNILIVTTVIEYNINKEYSYWYESIRTILKW